jgi:hypothetical protein
VFLNCYFAPQTEARDEASPSLTLDLGQDGGTGRKQKRLGRRYRADPTCTLESVLTMLDDTTNPNVRKTSCDLLLRVLSAIGSKIFRTDDGRARDRGWQIIPRHGGLSRTYRDPRFDYLPPCPACNGRSCNPERIACSGCHGSGRLVLDRVDITQPRRGQQEGGRS